MGPYRFGNDKIEEISRRRLERDACAERTGNVQSGPQIYSVPDHQKGAKGGAG